MENQYQGINPSLMKLAEFLKMAAPKPSHGYTISEAGPEIVTAPGVYFPSEKGEVIPLQSRAEGGPVSLNSSDTEKEKLGILREIISQVKPTQGMESRQLGGPVSPDGKPSILDEIEKSKYDIFKSAISALKPQKQQPVTGEGNTSLQSRRFGGKVDPLKNNTMFRSPENLWERKQMEGWGPGASRIVGGKSVGWKEGMTTPFAASKSPSLPTPPSLPGVPKPITSSSYGMMPEAMKPDKGEALWQKKRAALGWENPAEDLWEHKRKEAGVFDLTSRKLGGPVTPDDEYKRLEKLLALETPATVELAERKKWGRPRYPEARLAEAQKRSPTALGVSPGYEETYYEAHPEEARAQTIYDMLRPYGESSYEAGSERMKIMNLMDIAKDSSATREARAGAMALARGMQESRQGQETGAMEAASRAYALPPGITTPKQPAISPVGQLISERDALPPYDPRRIDYDAAIKKATEQVEKTPKLPPYRDFFDEKTGVTYHQEYEWTPDKGFIPTGKPRPVKGPSPEKPPKPQLTPDAMDKMYATYNTLRLTRPTDIQFNQIRQAMKQMGVDVPPNLPELTRGQFEDYIKTGKLGETKSTNGIKYRVPDKGIITIQPEEVDAFRELYKNAEKVE